MVKGIDCATKLTAQTAAAIRAEGYAFAGRYLVPNVGDLAWKALTRAEAEAITGAGLRLLTVWETAADRAKGGASAGASDGAAACAVARQIAMPEGGIIYFAVDYDAQPAEYRVIAEYLISARQQTGPYEVGVYGSYGVVEDMAARGVCRGFWQCVAWSYGKRSPNLTVYQGGYGQRVAGVDIDVNECPDMDAAGIWTYPAAEKAEAPTAEARYDTVAALPDWARGTVVKLINGGVIRGESGKKDADGYPTGLNLSYDMIRLLVTHDRLGLYDISRTEDDLK